MRRDFPIRVNRKDADRHFDRTGFKKKPESPIKIFSRGARHYLHPSLSILDKIDCELTYYSQDKVMVLSYDPSMENINNTDYKRKVYSKSVLSGDVGFIVDIVKEHIEDMKKENEYYNTQINSDDQPETIDITTEEYTV